MSEDVIILQFILAIIIAPLLGLIPAAIAREKGYQFNYWWLAGTLVFIIALPFTIFGLDDKNKKVQQTATPEMPQGGTGDATETIKKLSDLKDQNIITEEEFQKKKEELLTKV